MSCFRVRWAAQTPLVMTPCGGHPLTPETVHHKYFTFFSIHLARGFHNRDHDRASEQELLIKKILLPPYQKEVSIIITSKSHEVLRNLTKSLISKVTLIIFWGVFQNKVSADPPESYWLHRVLEQRSFFPASLTSKVKPNGAQL